MLWPPSEPISEGDLARRHGAVNISAVARARSAAGENGRDKPGYQVELLKLADTASSPPETRPGRTPNQELAPTPPDMSLGRSV